MPALLDPEALLQLARQDLANGQLDAAQAKCQQVLGTHRHHPAALDVLGAVLHSQGRHEDAVRVFNALTLMQPIVAAHWEHLGTALRSARRHEPALAAFERALHLGAPTPGLLYNLGALQMERCDHRAAYLALRDAAALEPANALMRWAFAQCCYVLGLRDEALSALQHWEALEGLTPDLTVQIALLLVATGAANLAQPALQRLLAHPPQKGRAAIGFASLLERVHRLDEARAVMQRLDLEERSLEREPEKRLMRAVLAERAGNHSEVHQHLSLGLREHTEFVHRHELLFPLAKACDALALYEEAFAAAEEAHRSQLEFLERATGRSSAAQSQMWSLTEHGCEPEDVAGWETDGPATENSPIFIVGFPRSGTTLLEQVLDAHPQLKSMDEQTFLSSAADEVSTRGIRYPAELGKLNRQALEEIRAHYWERVGSRVRLDPGQRLVDKNPSNMVLLPMIKRLFPRAHIILTIRHPCDTVLSCFLQHFFSHFAILCSDLTTLAAAYSRVFEFWYSQCPVLAPCSYELRYEELATNFAAEVHRLSDFLQLPWHASMLAPGEHARAKGFINTPSYAQVLEPVSSRSVGKWKHYESHFGAALPMLRPWIERWGYSAS